MEREKSKFSCKRKNKIVFVIFFFFAMVSKAQNFEDGMNLANNKFNNEEYAEALQDYDSLLITGQGDSISMAWIHSYMGFCYEELDEMRKAVEHFRLALEYKFPNYTIYDKLYSYAKSVKDYALQEYVLTTKMDMFPETEEDCYKSLCYVLANTKQFDRLIRITDQLIFNDPGNYKAYYFKGLAYQQKANNDEAIAVYKLAYNLKKDDYGVNRNLGFILYNLATYKFEEEKKKYERLPKPTRIDYYNYTTAVEVIKGEYTECEPYLLNAYSKRPDNELKKALYNLYVRTGRIETAEKYR